MTDMMQDLAVGYRKEQVKNVPKPTIVRFEGDWGVLLRNYWLDRLDWRSDQAQAD